LPPKLKEIIDDSNACIAYLKAGNVMVHVCSKESYRAYRAIKLFMKKLYLGCKKDGLKGALVNV
jgi:hypothetical protein